jgi:hypothetical protein
LSRFRGETNAAVWERTTNAAAEQSLEQIANWGLSEDWADWGGSVSSHIEQNKDPPERV